VILLVKQLLYIHT